MFAKANGRDVDAYVLGGVTRGQLPLTLSRDAHMAYGPALAVQKFLVNMLTTLGSIVTQPERGTDFMRQLVSGELRNETEVTMAFAAAATDTIRYLAGLRTDATDLDEEPLSVEVQAVNVLYDAVEIAATLTTASGRTIDFALPFGT